MSQSRVELISLPVLAHAGGTLRWLFAKATPIRAPFVAIAANVIAFAVFAFLLVRDLGDHFRVAD